MVQQILEGVECQGDGGFHKWGYTLVIAHFKKIFPFTKTIQRYPGVPPFSELETPISSHIVPYDLILSHINPH